MIGREQAEDRRGDEQHRRDGNDEGLPERALDGVLYPSADLQGRQQRKRRAQHDVRLAPGEDAEQEAQADGDRHRRERVLPDRLFGLVRGLHRLVLGAAELLVGDAANRRAQVLDVGADRFDLVGELLGLLARAGGRARLAARISVSEDM